jgi:large subunit ribosomal protein L3
VTVVEAGPCPVTQIKTDETDGYPAVQLGFGAQKPKRAPKAEVGHVAAAGLEVAPRVLREIPLSDGEAYELGQTLTVEQFEAGDKVKITGTSKGRGFQGVVKRHGFAGRPGGHGHPLSRTPGSLGPGTNPSRVIKGKKLPGRMGGARTTIRNVQVVKVDGERNLLFIKGGIPGARDSYVLITK